MYNTTFVEKIINEPYKLFFEHFPAQHVEVNNCLDAATARKIRLEEELKSILLKVNDTFYLLHFRGNEKLDSRLLERYFRNILKIKTKHKFRFASDTELSEYYNSSKGKVTPINKKLWEAYSFISPSLLNRKVVYTNDGTLTGYIKFDPLLLVRSPYNNIKDGKLFYFTTKTKIIMRTDAHKAMAGLLDTAFGPNELDHNMKKYFRRAKEIVFMKPSEPKYSYVRIIDTFFSDTMDSKLFLEIISESLKYKYQIQIILLNPFSQSAEEREKSLSHSDNRIKRLNTGLYNIKTAIAGTDNSFNDEFSNNFDKPEYIFDQIDSINQLKHGKGYENFELRFSMVGRLPLYMFGQYACSGQFLDFASSRDTPWYIWVDDPNEPDDQYDNYRKHFESLWKKSCELKVADFKKYIRDNSERFIHTDAFGFNRRNVFLSYGHDESTMLRVQAIVRDNDYVPIVYDSESQTTNDESIIPNLIKSMFSKCSSSLVLMTKDDVLINGVERCRPNVLLELGYAQSLFGALVLILVEKGLEIPTNLSGYSFAYMERDENGRMKLPEAEIIRFLGRVKRILG